MVDTAVSAHSSRRELLRVCTAALGLAMVSACDMPFIGTRRARQYRIGYLIASTACNNAGGQAAFRQGLRDLGYVDGQNLTVEVRSAEGKEELIPGLVNELAGLDLDVMVVPGNVALTAAERAGVTTPIVFYVASDPVENGLVDSLARPGRNATGLTQEAGTEAAKRLELLKQTVPSLRRVAAFWSSVSARRLSETQTSAKTLGIDLLPLELKRVDEVESLLAAAVAAHPDGMIVVGGPMFSALESKFFQFAATNRVPAMYDLVGFATDGGLMAYAPDTIDSERRAASFADRILKGSNPAEIPIERPSKFNLVINLTTANSLGLSIPPDIAAQVTQWA